MDNFKKLYDEAFKLAPTKKLSEFASSGGVGAAILGANGKIYTGTCVDACSGIGFCAEHAAVAEMLKDGESRIVEMLAVFWDGRVGPPCGRCRELISEVHPENKQTKIWISKEHLKTLSELLPNSYS